MLLSCWEGGHLRRGHWLSVLSPEWGTFSWLCARDDSPDWKVASPRAYLMDNLNPWGPCSVNNTSLPLLSVLRSAGRRQIVLALSTQNHHVTSGTSASERYITLGTSIRSSHPPPRVPPWERGAGAPRGTLHHHSTMFTTPSCRARTVARERGRRRRRILHKDCSNTCGLEFIRRERTNASHRTH